MVSIAKLKNTMLITNNQRPTPAISPICVLVKLNSLPHCGNVSARRTKPKEVVDKAITQSQNNFMSGGGGGGDKTVFFFYFFFPRKNFLKKKNTFFFPT